MFGGEAGKEMLVWRLREDGGGKNEGGKILTVVERQLFINERRGGGGRGVAEERRDIAGSCSLP